MITIKESELHIYVLYLLIWVFAVIGASIFRRELEEKSNEQEKESKKSRRRTLAAFIEVFVIISTMTIGGIVGKILPLTFIRDVPYRENVLSDPTSSTSPLWAAYVSSRDGWGKSLDGREGDIFTVRINSELNTEKSINIISARAMLSDGLTYVPGSTILTDKNHSSGIKLLDGIAAEDVYIGEYEAGDNVQISFDVIIGGNNTATTGIEQIWINMSTGKQIEALFVPVNVLDEK